MQTSKKTFTGLVLDENCILSMDELCSACCVHIEYIVELVDEGIIEPLDHDPQQDQWNFTGDSLVFVGKARRLQQDLGINLAGVALILDMMREIELLREQLRRLD